MRKNQLKLTVQRPFRVGICLAQPYFYDNINKASLFDSLLTVLVKLYYEHNIEYHILAFNYDKDSKHEYCAGNVTGVNGGKLMCETKHSSK